MSSATKVNCPICFEKYNHSCHAPISTPCGHTVCAFCFRQTTTNDRELDCVLCRRKIGLEVGQFEKNILMIELLDQIGELGSDNPCMMFECSHCNPPSPRVCPLDCESSESTQNEDVENVDLEMIEQLIGYFERFLQLNPEVPPFLLRGQIRTAERQVLSSYFHLLDECATERNQILDTSSNLYDDNEANEPNWREAETRQVRIYARRFETLCTYMITSILRLRTLNSFSLYGIQRIRSYYSLRHKIDFVELGPRHNTTLSRRECQNINRLEVTLSRMACPNNLFTPIVETTESECDFIEILTSREAVHCLICNSVVHNADVDSIDQHIQSTMHQRLVQEAELLPLQILLSRASALRLCSSDTVVGSSEVVRAEVTTNEVSRPRTSGSNAQSRVPTFFA